MKRIAVQKGLEEIRKGLRSKGYEVVNFNEGHFVDAIVYTNDYGGLENVNNNEESNSNGAVLINATNRSMEEIQYVIENRRYEGLFT
ncbi:conserved hypothetical protein [Alkaliphilus metalliredigens QYMF]|uniref:YkuS family protein n=1 Tax=Alkaliphilus metalliredigens (strain QYMF) TaxID=293826 RepID=A6TXD4_ALKMQ|nr:YkuS family protein [Alkaliphilus metalliredigens]ABR50852.1 conserved hypothetical protein [Alkaliphilus metalliredigens QYMF]